MHRIANISQLDAEERAGNALKKPELEYAVRGHFLMSKHDKYGRHATFYVPYHTMMRDLDDLPAELEIFEGNIALHRENVENLFGEESEESEGGGEDQYQDHEG